MYSRREFGKMALAGLSLSMVSGSPLWADAKSEDTVKGVKLGAITGAYGPFKPAPGQDVVDVVIKTSQAYGVGYVELVNSLIEPPMGGVCRVVPPPGGFRQRPGGRILRNFNPPCGIGGQVPKVIPPGYEEERDKLRQWRLHAPLDRFREIRRKFASSGVELYSYVMTIGDDFTEPEIDAVFKQMQALGVNKFCTNQTRVDMASRMVPYAEKYKIRPAFHTHDKSHDPNEISSPASLAKVLAMSKYFMVNLDIGWFYDGGNDPLAYLKAHPDRITHLHVRDRKAPYLEADIGTGVLHVDEMLRFVRDNHYDIAFIVEQRGRAGAKNANEAVKMNIDYMKHVLLS